MGATGNDTRAFPKTFHIWGGYPSNYTHYDLLIGSPNWNLTTLRAANPGAIYLANPKLDPFNPDWRLWKGMSVTYGGADTFTGTTDTVVDGSAANLGTIPAWNKYWDTLHRPDGSVALISSEFGHPGWNLTRTETAEKTAEILTYGAKLSKIYQNGWDGIWSDNWFYRIGAGWFYGSNLDTNRDGRADDMSAVTRQWWDGLNLVGQRLRSNLPGKFVGGNGSYHISGMTPGSDPNGPFKASNVTLNEVLQFYTSKPDTIVSEVQSYLGFPDPYGMPRYFLLMHKLPGGQGDLRSMRWGFSLATIAGGYYEPYAVDHNDAFKYDEFTGGAIGKRGWLGAPTSAPTKLSSGVWRRDFQNGVVLNNSTAAAQVVSLGATYRRLKGTQDTSVNSGAEVTSVTVPAGDGLFLAGSGGAGTTLPQNTGLPTISGSTVVGQTLSASPGTWSGSPTSYAYQWQRCDTTGVQCTDVVSATSSKLVMGELDAGWRFRVKVVATNGAGSAVATSASTAVVTDVFEVTQSIAEGSILSSTVAWTASPVGKTVSKVDFSVDGKVVATDNSAPYSTSLGTTSLTNAMHVFTVQALATDGTTTSSAVNAAVSNQANALTVTQSLSTGQTISGSVLWRAAPAGKSVAKVEFAIDGALVSTDSSDPYEVVVDSSRVADGAHVFAVKAYAVDGATATATATVTVSNAVSPPSAAVTQNIRADQILTGTVDWIAQSTDSSMKRVEFLVDGAKVATKPNPPFQISFDTKKIVDGTHSFGVAAYGNGGATTRIHVLARVANNSPAPSPSPSPPASPAPSLSVSQSVESGRTLSGAVSWTATAAGKTVERVEFFIDGQLSWTERYAPYFYAGDGNTLDTKVLSNGSHTLSVKAYATDGTTSSATASVLVSNTTTSTLISSIKDGSTITGEVSWTITPTGKPLSRMEFFIDGQLMWTERLSPWVYGGDGRKLDASTLSRGQHTFVVKAYATDGTVEVLTLTVTVG